MLLLFGLPNNPEATSLATMPALHPIVDIHLRSCHVSFVPIADIREISGGYALDGSREVSMIKVPAHRARRPNGSRAVH